MRRHRESTATSHDQGHRGKGGSLERRRLVRAQRSPRPLRPDTRANPLDREGSGLVPEPCSARPLGGACKRLRPRARPAREDACLRALLHGVHLRRRVGLSAQSIALAIRLAEDIDEEIAVYRLWWAERRVDGVFVVDLRTDDPRLDEIARLGLPAVVVGGPLGRGDLPAVWHDEASVVTEVVRHLAELGHTRLARVAGVPAFVHTAARTTAFRRTVRSLSLTARVAPPTSRRRAAPGRRDGS